MALSIVCPFSAVPASLPRPHFPASFTPPHRGPMPACTSFRSEVEVIAPRKSCPPRSGKSRLLKDQMGNAAKIFSDESKGIVCYRSESGEVTCEGFDEGPHFHPSAQHQPPRLHSTLAYSETILPDLLPTGFAPFWSEASQYIRINEYTGALLYEGKYQN
eukprot:c23902_g1_i1 orf=200-679(+)